MHILYHLFFLYSVCKRKNDSTEDNSFESRIFFKDSEMCDKRRRAKVSTSGLKNAWKVSPCPDFDNKTKVSNRQCRQLSF